jgi:hypothetical protein
MVSLVAARREVRAPDGHRLEDNLKRFLLTASMNMQENFHRPARKRDIWLAEPREEIVPNLDLREMQPDRALSRSIAEGGRVRRLDSHRPNERSPLVLG